ncbi:hypothetical protein D9M68_958590 [compost metagenome]
MEQPARNTGRAFHIFTYNGQRCQAVFHLGSFQFFRLQLQVKLPDDQIHRTHRIVRLHGKGNAMFR